MLFARIMSVAFTIGAGGSLASRVYCEDGYRVAARVRKIEEYDGWGVSVYVELKVLWVDD